MIKAMLLATVLLTPVGHSTQGLDTVVGVYCGSSLEELVVISGFTGRVVMEWPESPTNGEFKKWVKRYYGVENANDITFNARRVNKEDCASS